jgi:hypothetical protein
LFQFEFCTQGFNRFLIQFAAIAAFQQAWQRDVAVAHAFEATDLKALRFPQTANLAIATFIQHDLEPGVRITRADAFDFVELGRAVIQCYAACQTIDDVVRHFALDANNVFALDGIRWVHQGIRQFTVGGQQQQTGGVDVQTTNGNPARAFQTRQRFKYGRATFRIFVGGDLAFRLVVNQYAGRFGQSGGDKRLAIQFDAVAAMDGLSDLRDFAINLDDALGNAFFQCPT